MSFTFGSKCSGVEAWIASFWTLLKHSGLSGGAEPWGMRINLWSHNRSPVSSTYFPRSVPPNHSQRS